MAASKLPNGTAKSKSGTATPAVAPEQQAQSTLPPVVGINFGNSYASIAVFTKEGVAECIANEDGERQIACAISFHGEELYIGNQAKHQLVKNSKNTITGFRNLLGKKFTEIQPIANPTSAPLIQHPAEPDTPAYNVAILQPAPAPLPASAHPSNLNTPQGSIAPTPMSEPVPATRILTPLEVTSIFLRSLVQSAEDFLGKKVEGAVLTVPDAFTPKQHDDLLKAAADAGINVLQLLDDAGATAATTTSPSWSPDSPLPADRTQLVIDAGASSLAVSLLSIRHGLAYVLASSHSDKIQPGNQIDDALVKHFATEFTKKTKVPFAALSSTPSAQDARAEAKLRLALEYTKRTISASPGAATCSVESLKDGMDFNSSLNRMRFDMLARSVYTAISNEIVALLEQAQLDAHDIDELVYVGGTTSLPGLDEHVQVSLGLREEIESPFARGTVIGGGVGDPTTVIARGCAIQAELIASIPADQTELKEAFTRESKASEVKATSKTLGFLFPSGNPEDGNGVGGVFIPAVAKETALPARRILTFDVSLPDTEPKKFAFELVEVTEGIRIEKVKPPPVEDDEEEEEEEELEIKHRTLTKGNVLGALTVDAKLGIKATGKVAKEELKGTWSTHVQATVVVSIDGAVEVSIVEVGGEEGAKASLKVEAP